MTAGFKVDVLAQTTTGLGGNAIAFPRGPAELETHLVEVAAGAEVGRHRHPAPCHMYVLAGTIVAELEDGTRQTFESGQAFVEDGDVWVNNINPGDTPARFLAVVVGPAGASKVSFPD
jgi:quercetin dioxygenase-like cupin family protein